ncbi:hypothetical protein FHX41_5039 [Actinomadura hallensis]|uniref:Uncharacterized protein n=1 Tax=Actinomadura hallensis TaxID=337895 RepID=A0A543IL09_9ACTN|nr:hypothetical protein [Actinomadura hallensis]TQM71277.1 hypothetical protein FHX41_5039 [Actinomadura hallensis]
MTTRAPRPRPRPARRPAPRARFVAVPSPSSSSSSSPSSSRSSSPSSSGPSSGSSGRPAVSSWDVWPVGVEFDAFRSLHIARCQRCAEVFSSPRPGEADAWADTHVCDPELAALLAAADVRRAA